MNGAGVAKCNRPESNLSVSLEVLLANKQKCQNLYSLLFYQTQFPVVCRVDC